MEHLSTWEESEGGKVLRMGRKAIQQGEAINTETELRDRLIDLVSVGNLRHKPEALLALFRQFPRRISLPRLIHFFDLVLPQLMPVQAAWAGEEKTLWSCHHIRHLRAQQYANRTPSVQISYFFTSHHHVHHVRIQWNGHPLLLFSDPLVVEARPADHFRKQASHVTHQQHLQMGLRKGMAILLYYVVGDTHYQAVVIAEDSVVGRGGKGENRLWKRVTMIVTKENVAAHAFAKHFLRLGLPDSINSLVGRLVSYVELQKGPASRTDLDIPPAFRNDVLKSKQVIIGCGGGLHQECQQPYSPVATWMEDADVALNDRGNNTVTWMKPLQWRAHRANALSSGVATTNKPLEG